MLLTVFLAIIFCVAITLMMFKLRKCIESGCNIGEYSSICRILSSSRNDTFFAVLFNSGNYTVCCVCKRTDTVSEVVLYFYIPGGINRCSYYEIHGKRSDCVCLVDCVD